MISNDCGRPFPIRQRYVKKNAKPPDARQIPVVLFAIRKRIPEKHPDSAQKKHTDKESHTAISQNCRSLRIPYRL